MTRRSEMGIKETLEYIHSVKWQGSKPGLERTRELLAALGNPEKSLKFVHIAGTNGKGSTARMLTGALIRAGYRTGEFTSPHISVYNERIRVNGAAVPDGDLCELARFVRPVFEQIGEKCSQFELTCAMAFLYFLGAGVGAAVVETGIGGLLDCTNIVEKPLVSVITSVSSDHTALLGETVESIARHKAGIIKGDVPVVLAGNQKKEAHATVYKKALLENAPFVTPDYGKLRVGKCGRQGNSFTYRGLSYVTKMPGLHQIDNALAAVETANTLAKAGLRGISYDCVYEGLKNAVLPSRCQIIKETDPIIIIDGAHNPDGMRALADFIRGVPKEPKVMVCGMSENKDWRAALGYITRYVDKAVCVDGFMPETVFAPKLAQMFKDGETANLNGAVPRAVSYAGDRGMVVIAGSLYLASALGKFM